MSSDALFSFPLIGITTFFSSLLQPTLLFFLLLQPPNPSFPSLTCIYHSSTFVPLPLHLLCPSYALLTTFPSLTSFQPSPLSLLLPFPSLLFFPFLSYHLSKYLPPFAPLITPPLSLPRPVSAPHDPGNNQWEACSVAYSE